MSVVHVFAGEVVGVFAHVERTDENGAGCFQPFHQHRIVRRGGMRAVDLRSGARRQTLHVEQVLHRERNAGEGANVLAAGDRGIDGLGAAGRAFGRYVGEGVQRGIARGDARERVGNDVCGAQASAS